MVTNRSRVDLVDAGDGFLNAAIRLGDRDAFEVVVHRYGPGLYRYARRMLAGENDAADVVQETFTAAWRRSGSFRGAASLRTWLFSICAHKVVDSYRVKQAQPIDGTLLEALPATDRNCDPFTAASGAGFVAALEEALAELPPRQRASWVLHEIESMTFPEIGAALGLSAGASRGQYSRATKTLQDRLERWR
ncbi:RNA polymerase sigma factor [Mycolicibacterium baixiangningiae]|uniref:RNA polymerase sigma factor n=1 Tax=Mycolicibacterium baixiangningiae TaxID=2761578 RepID=UPI001E617E90|nr:RNA polymerase sigma factor [Mycolicibacterium baixiangningiae]